jgi:hypothetical protein
MGMRTFQANSAKMGGAGGSSNSPNFRVQLGQRSISTDVPISTETFAN